MVKLYCIGDDMYKNDEFLKQFKNSDQKEIIDFFEKLEKKQSLNKNDYKKIVKDFENYILYSVTIDSVSKTLERLSLKNFEVGYQDNDDWYPLDTSSKIYPLSMREEWMSIYRLSLYLNEKINKTVLQLALDLTIIRFPLFRTSIHKGFFWNYFDSINKRFKVEEEDSLPCSFINLSKNHNQSFRVIYYENRISCEFFHVLADAHGGMVFLVSLVNEYLRLTGKRVGYNNYALSPSEKASLSEYKDAFDREVSYETGGKLIEKRALQLDGKRSKIRPSQIIHFDLDLSKLKSLAKGKDLTINELLLSFLFVVLSYSISKDGNIKIQVPVNMRKFYPSKTLRNFSLYNTIDIEKKKITTLNEVMEIVKKQSREKLDKKSLDKVMYHAKKIVKSVSFLPLNIKNPIAKSIYRFFGDSSSTTVLSNLGKIELPKEMEKSVIKGDFVLGTSVSNRILFSVITIGNILTLSISKFTNNTSVENNLYSLLKEYDLIIKIHGSDKYEIRK